MRAALNKRFFRDFFPDLRRSEYTSNHVKLLALRRKFCSIQSPSNQAQPLSFRGREAEPGTHEHRSLRTVARRLGRRVYGSRALLRSPGMTEPGWVILAT